MSMTEDNEQKAIIAWARWQPVAGIGLAGVIADYLHHSQWWCKNRQRGQKIQANGYAGGIS